MQLNFCLLERHMKIVLVIMFNIKLGTFLSFIANFKLTKLKAMAWKSNDVHNNVISVGISMVSKWTLWKNALLRSHHWLQASWGASFWETAKTSCESRGGPKHNRCCLISKIIERQGWIPWQLSPYVLLELEEHQGRIRSAEVNCALWNSMLKQHHGRRKGWGRLATHR